jgi:hypothetical protein
MKLTNDRNYPTLVNILSGWNQFPIFVSHFKNFV